MRSAVVVRADGKEGLPEARLFLDVIVELVAALMWVGELVKGLESDRKLNTKPSLGNSFARGRRMMSPVPFHEPAGKPNEDLAKTPCH
jgi:hypothetical protein